MKIRRLVGVAALLAAGIVLANFWTDHNRQPEGSWGKMVRTKGQHYPIPARWISTPEGRIAHDLVLPPEVPRPVPFDFDAADGPWFWPKSDWEVAKAYFNHLCSTEAGEWIFEKKADVEGLYFARPLGTVTNAYLSNIYAVEAPFVEKEFHLMGDDLDGRGGEFIQPPFRNYSFVEEPRRQTEWQADIMQPYIRFFGYSATWKLWKDWQVQDVEVVTPIRVRGIIEPSAEYALTWRGVSRPLDREYRIAGGELIVYERVSRKVIAISRTFQLGKTSGSKASISSWFQSPACRQGVWPGDIFMTEFARRVLQDRPLTINSQDKGTYLWRFQQSRNFMNSP
ncbi:MAG: exported protein of unknown function [Moraxellaceae bacterium]|jgi:hypothetical protein|nr:exported protein of unknown function [Moraxellaceae bacterium]